MSTQNKIILGVVGLVFVLTLATILLFRKSNEASTTGPTSKSTSTSPTRSEVPVNVVVPGANDTSTVPGVAVPKVVIQAAPNVLASFRSFDIKVNGDTFIPNTFIIKEGDTVHLSITAVDKAYDFTQPDYGFKLLLPQGKAKILEFAAVNTGKFIFYCEKCGGPNKGPVGSFIITPK